MVVLVYVSCDGNVMTAVLRNTGRKRSTIEVHPNFSEAPHLRGSIPRPKPDSSKNQIASR